LTQQLGELGVEIGGVLLVHAVFSRIAPVEHGPRGLIEALLGAVGDGGTLVMPSMADDDDTPKAGSAGAASEMRRRALRARATSCRPRWSACAGMKQYSCMPAARAANAMRRGPALYHSAHSEVPRC